MIKMIYFYVKESQAPYHHSFDEVVASARSGDDHAFFRLYKMLSNGIEIHVRKYYYIDAETVRQEARIELFHCVHHFDDSRSVSFEKYFFYRLKMRMLMFLREEQQYSKRIVSLNHSLHEDTASLEEKLSVEDSRLKYVTDFIVLNKLTPVDLNLSLLEQRIFNYMRKDYSLEKMCELENCSIKTVRNAIHRVRDKVSKFMMANR